MSKEISLLLLIVSFLTIKSIPLLAAKGKPARRAADGRAGHGLCTRGAKTSEKQAVLGT